MNLAVVISPRKQCRPLEEIKTLQVGKVYKFLLGDIICNKKISSSSKFYKSTIVVSRTPTTPEVGRFSVFLQTYLNKEIILLYAYYEVSSNISGVS